MDLAKFAKLPPENNGSFLKFTPDDNIKIVRFCYRDASEIQVRQKLYDAATKKVIWDSPEGKWTMQLKVAVYKSKSEYELMTWDRSARFGADVLMPLFEAAGGDIIDTVYKVTCSKAGTLDASFTFFPMRDSDAYAMPTLASDVAAAEAAEEAPAAAQEVAEPVSPANKAAKRAEPASAPAPAPAPAASPATAKPAKKRFWEE